MTADEPIELRFTRIEIAVPLLTLGLPAYGAARSILALGLSNRVDVSIYMAVNQPLQAQIANGIVPFLYLLGLLLLPAYVMPFFFRLWGTYRPTKAEPSATGLPPMSKSERRIFWVSTAIAVVASVAVDVRMGVFLFVATVISTMNLFPPRGATLSSLSVARVLGLVLLGLLISLSGLPAASVERVATESPMGTIRRSTEVLLPQNGDSFVAFRCLPDGKNDPRPRIISASAVVARQPLDGGERRWEPASLIDLLTDNPDAVLGFAPACPS